jgi:alpha-tubulin suppressor-like RCC1 family protein/pimeloyl-ACP methyl ester carboxylesterase
MAVPLTAKAAGVGSSLGQSGTRLCGDTIGYHSSPHPFAQKPAMRRQVSLATLGCIAVSLSCSGGDRHLTNPSPTPTTVTIQPDSGILVKGSHLQLTATVRDAQGSPIPSAQVIWSTSDTSAATVTPQGSVHGAGFGQARITASVGSVSGTTIVTVRYPNRDSATVRAADSTVVAAGSGATVTIPAGAFAAGTVVTLLEETAEPDTSDGTPLGATFRLSVTAPAGGVQGNWLPMRQSISSALGGFKITTPLDIVSKGVTDLAEKTVYLVIRPAANATVQTAIAAAKVTVATGKFGNKVAQATFVVPFTDLVNYDTGLVYDWEFSAVHASQECDNEPGTWAFYKAAGSGTDTNSDKIPLILIHGWQFTQLTCKRVRGFHPERANETWGPLISGINAAGDSSRYEVWVYRYPTFYPIETSAARLSSFITSKFPSRAVVLVGHSMGGLVGAYYTGYAQSSNVRQLITLATPFRGSPAAVRPLAGGPQAQAALVGCAAGLGSLAGAADIVGGNWVLGTEGGRELNPASPFYGEVLDPVSSRFVPKLWSLSGTTSLKNLTSGGSDAVLAVLGCYLAASSGESNDGVVTVSSANQYGTVVGTPFPSHDHIQMTRASDIVDAVTHRLAILASQIPSDPRKLSVASGDAQSGAPGRPLPLSLGALVSDAAGVPVPGVSISFTVASGGGSLSATTVSTNSDGIARTQWTLGPQTGDQSVTATAPAFAAAPVTFHGTATTTGGNSDVPLPHAQVSAGNDHACATNSVGAAFCWGSNTVGSIGNDSATDYTRPVHVAGGHMFAQIAAGGAGAGYGQYEHSCGVATDGAGFCWGSADWGEIGTTVTTCGFQKQGACVPVPVEGNLKFMAMATGSLHTCGLTTNGAAYCWGYGGSGALGTGTVVYIAHTPQPVAGGLRFKAIDAAGNWSCALTADGTAYCWGASGGGLGSTGPSTCDSPSTCVTAPTKVSGELTFKDLTVGGSFSCGVTTAGDAYCWGSNTWGQLGDGTTTDSPTPVKVTGGLTFAAIDAGAEHVCAVTTAHGSYCWGQGLAGSLGNGGSVESHVPVPVSGALAFAQISAGTGFTCGTTTDDQIWCWGYDSSGKLGNGDGGSSTVPVFVLNAHTLPPAGSRAARRSRAH